MKFDLQAFHTPSQFRVGGAVELQDSECLLNLDIRGPVATLDWERPDDRRQAFITDLWRGTCFELFFQAEDGRYWEWNIAPHGAWACFSFSSYRTKTGDLRDIEHPRLQIQKVRDRWQIAIKLCPTLPVKLCHRLGISSVLRHGTTTEYFALSHPSSQPDFHDPRSFVNLF
ncbi:hypothetical protein [Pseudobacteriovorax antillogorgiicola]|uniref:DOMON-like domain-containing protein n=1 Tax=Pseudobacteriovorax antillogorgiicola TaxID=1513793 RepID=A0A1Y6B8S0_9BACT|nr:hypothetical protein [Pseudobacteriovorax antillogorgiicola]TCS58566.1 hypothetical protein EDD56_10279 [Pseudobacteriovorax antillogorgiicola]SME97489.1 hypothetical protein SAMN06296036_102364 [Pseudobacteriovorax antillogorgiicola]